MRPDDTAAALRRWAHGLLPAEAAVELIFDAVGGRLRDGPWVRQDDLGHVHLDPEVAAAEGGRLSGGERRVLAIATSLISGEYPVDLGDAITGLDPDALERVLVALAHAGGHRPAADRHRPKDVSDAPDDLARPHPLTTRADGMSLTPGTAAGSGGSHVTV